jgi:hypothetical protein
MKKYLSLIALSVLVLASCSKEKSFEDPNATPGSGGGTNVPKDSLLTRMVVDYGGGDSDVTVYGYDASRRFTSYALATESQGATFHKEIYERRNAQGIVTQTIQKDDSLRLAYGVDSLVYNVNYNAATARYTSKVAALTISGFSLKDSIAYTYDASGKLVTKEDFLSGNGSPYAPQQKSNFAYDASGNLNDVKFSAMSGTSYVLVYEDGYQFDANVNPLKMLGVESILIDLPELYSVHNVNKDTFVDFLDNSFNDITGFNFQYTTQSKPASAIVSFQSGGGGVATYYYQ